MTQVWSQGLHPGQLLIDMSTVGPDAESSVADRLPQGVSLVDAPVRGSIAEAAAGRLHVFVGASDADFARVRPILAVFGDVRHTGGPGSGQAMKLVVNLVLGAAMVVLGEALALGASLALPEEMVLDVLSDSPIGPAVAAKRANIESGSYEPAFALRLAEKDLKLVTDTAAPRRPRPQSGARDSGVARGGVSARRRRPRLLRRRGDDRGRERERLKERTRAA